jgi:hypothetical protein
MTPTRSGPQAAPLIRGETREPPNAPELAAIYVRRATSQSFATTSYLSAFTVSWPAPQSIVSRCPSRESMMSLPAPPWRRSSPGPPIRWSLPAPPSSLSSPVPPFSRSLPANPLKVSFPPSPFSLSLRAVPTSVFAFAFPVFVTPTVGLDGVRGGMGVGVVVAVVVVVAVGDWFTVIVVVASAALKMPCCAEAVAVNDCDPSAVTVVLICRCPTGVSPER